MDGRLSNKVALVTGAGSGIGQAAARRLAREGAVVVGGLLDDIQRDEAAGYESRVLDVRQPDAWDEALDAITSAHGGLDILVNSAGVHRAGGVDETSREDWDLLMDVNLYGTFLGCRKAIPLMRGRGGGAIVNLASIASHRGVARQVAYATTKGGVLAMTLALAVDHVGDGIRINCVCPGATETPIIDGLVASYDDPAAFRARLTAIAPMGRMGLPDEVAAAIAYLVSDDASYTTGVALPVDGGRSGR